MRIAAKTVLAEANPDVLQAKKLWEQIKTGLKNDPMLANRSSPDWQWKEYSPSPGLAKAIDKYIDLGLTIPLHAYVDGGSAKKLVVCRKDWSYDPAEARVSFGSDESWSKYVMFLFEVPETYYGGEVGWSLKSIGRRPPNDDIWDLETGERLYINTQKTRKNWADSIFTNPEGEI